MSTEIKDVAVDSYDRLVTYFVRAQENALKVGILLFFVVMVGLPLVYFVWGSFWTTSPGLGGHFTLEGYMRLSNIGETLGNTLMLAIFGTLLSLILGLGMVMFTFKTNAVAGTLLSYIFIIQYFVPSFLQATAWRFYGRPNGGLNQILMLLPFIDEPVFNIFTLYGMILVSGLHYGGFVFLMTNGAIRSVPRVMEEAGIIAGAGYRQITTKILFKLALPSIFISTVIIFTRLIQTLGLPLILGLQGRVFVVSVHIYTASFTYPPDFNFAAVLGLVVLVLALVGLAIQQYLLSRQERYETVFGAGEDTSTLLQYDLGRFSPVISGVILLFMILFYILPFVAMIASSFQEALVAFDFEHATWTLGNYEALFVGEWSSKFYTIVRNTMLLIVGGGVVATALATACSYYIVKTEGAASTLIDYFTFAPIGIPGIVFGVTFLWIFLEYNFLGLYGTIWLLVIVLIAKEITYGVRAVNSSLRSVGKPLEDAARASGATLTGILRKIFFPLITPGIFAAYMLIVIDFINGLTLALFLGTTDESKIIQVLLWELLSSGQEGEAAALSVLMILGIGLMYGLILKMTKADVTEI